MTQPSTSQLGNLVTIVVSPRERQYSIIPSLLSLFSTAPREVRVIVAQGDIPLDLRHQLRELNQLRTFDLIATEYPLYPQEARNLGIDQCSTEFIVIADNDIEYEAGWLEALIGNAERNKSDLVAPLIFIGPPRSKVVHHAGGRIRAFALPDGTMSVQEEHQFMNRNIDEVDVASLGETNQVVEFHCFLARKTFLDKSGPLDERLITREQIDYGLRARHLGAKVTFEREAKVTYIAKKDFTKTDLKYLSFRWNDQQAIEAMEVFEQDWGIKIDKMKVLHTWIRAHRARAYGTIYTAQHRNLPPPEFYQKILAPLEHEVLTRADKLRGNKTKRHAQPMSATDRPRTLDYFRG